VSVIKTLDVGINATTFTYSVSSEADSVLPKQIACAFNGIWTGISDDADLRRIMSTYYNVLSLGIKLTTPIWTEPYNDASGLGNMTTCALAVYDNTRNPPLLLGVVGVDVLMDELQKYDNHQTVLKGLISRS
jgi:hypothetical protein